VFEGSLLKGVYILFRVCRHFRHAGCHNIWGVRRQSHLDAELGAQQLVVVVRARRGGIVAAASGRHVVPRRRKSCPQEAKATREGTRRLQYPVPKEASEQYLT